MKINLIISLVLILSMQRMFAQGCCPYINSVVQLPANPTETDTICFVSDINIPSNGFTLSTNLLANGSQIDFSACYFSGMLPVITNAIDTVCLGVLPPGTYSLQFSGTISFDNNQCIPADTNSTGFSFTVSPSPVGLNAFHSTWENRKDLLVSVNDFKARFGRVPLLLYDACGRQKTPVSDLQPGFYFVYDLSDNKFLCKLILTD